MKRKPLSPEDLQNLIVPDMGKNEKVNQIVNCINALLLDAREEEHNLTLVCQKCDGIVRASIKKDKPGIYMLGGPNPTEENFQKAINAFKKEWGGKLAEKELEHGTQYCFLMF